MDLLKETLKNIRERAWEDIEMKVSENYWRTTRETTLDKEIERLK